MEHFFFGVIYSADSPEPLSAFDLFCLMTTEEMKHLERGDIVKHALDPRTFIVTGNYGGRVTAVATVDITNPPEWEVVLKADWTNSSD